MSENKATIKRLTQYLRGNVASILGANVLNKAVVMLSNMVIARMLTNAEYGIWSYVLNIYSYFTLISGFGLMQGAFQFGAETQGTEKEFSYYRFCLNIGLAINVVLIGGTGVFLMLFSLPIPQAEIYVEIYVPILLLEYAMNVLQVILRSENRIKEYAFALNVNTVMLAIGTSLGSCFGLMGLVGGRYIAFFCSLVFLLVRLRPEMGKLKKAKKLRWAETGALWHYSLLTGVSDALNVALYLLDVSMIAALIRDPEQLSIYKMATYIPTALSFIPSSVAIAMLPRFIANRNDPGKLKKSVAKQFFALGAGNAAVCLGLGITAPLVIYILAGPNYSASVPVFRVLLLGYFISGTFRVLSANALAGLRAVNFNLMVSILSILCDVVFNYILIQKFGMIGAAYATLSVQIVSSVAAFSALMWIIARRKS